MGILDQILQQQLQGGQRGGVRAPQVGLANPGQIQAPPLGGVAPAARAAQQAPGGGFGAGFTTAFNQSANRAGVASENALQREAAEDLMLQRQAQMNQRETNRIAASTAAAKLKFGRDQQLADAKIAADNAAFQRDLGKPRNVGPDTNVVQRNPQTGEFETVYTGRKLTVPGAPQTEFEKILDAEDAKRMSESTEKVSMGLAENAQLGEMIRIAESKEGDDIIYAPGSNTLTQIEAAVRGWAGLQPSERLANQEAMGKANANIVAKFVQRGGRAVSDSDRAAFEKALPNASDTRATVVVQAKAREKINDHESDIHNAKSDYAIKNKNLRGWFRKEFAMRKKFAKDLPRLTRRWTKDAIKLGRGSSVPELFQGGQLPLDKPEYEGLRSN